MSANFCGCGLYLIPLADEHRDELLQIMADAEEADLTLSDITNANEFPNGDERAMLQLLRGRLEAVRAELLYDIEAPEAIQGYLDFCHIADGANFIDSECGVKEGDVMFGIGVYALPDAMIDLGSVEWFKKTKEGLGAEIVLWVECP